MKVLATGAHGSAIKSNKKNKLQPDKPLMDDMLSRTLTAESLSESLFPNGRPIENLLIWSDNLSALEQLSELCRGQVDFIYSDPPFDVGVNFKMDVPVGVQASNLKKDRSHLSLVAYQDRYGLEHYLAMLTQRVRLMRELLAETGSLVIHIDWREIGRAHV